MSTSTTCGGSSRIRAITYSARPRRTRCFRDSLTAERACSGISELVPATLTGRLRPPLFFSGSTRPRARGTCRRGILRFPYSASDPKPPRRPQHGKRSFRSDNASGPRPEKPHRRLTDVPVELAGLPFPAAPLMHRTAGGSLRDQLALAHRAPGLPAAIALGAPPSDHFGTQALGVAVIE